MPHDPAEYAFAVKKVTQGLDALADVSPCALELVVSLIEVLALRREEPESPDFYSSTFPGCPGLVRFTNTHRDETDLYELIEGLVHESIHCLLHVYEEIQGPFVRKQDDSHRKVQSPWSGTTIRLQSYVHACAVWYGLYWLWSHHDFAAGPCADRVAVMRQRAGFGFQFRPVSVVLAAYRPLLSNEVWPFLLELEDRMLPYLEKGPPAWLPR